MSHKEDLKELRRIIVGDNADELERLKERVENVTYRADDVAEVLAPAINKGISQDARLGQAFEKPVADGLTKAVQKDPETIANALYPVMAPAIRRAISEAISSMLSTINQTIESATTVGGIRTRFESFRTGISYAELTLRKSLLYRVEQVFLIDRTSGLLISELKNENVESLDSDGVSAMFSAIQSFVQDSFSQNEEDRLTDLTVGDHRIWVVHGPKAMLACVIRGEAPASLKNVLHDSLDSIRKDFAMPLANFEGDSSEFIGVEEYLRPCLQLERRQADQESKASLSSILLACLVACLIIYLAYSMYDKQRTLKQARAVLDQTPGLVVTNSHWERDKIAVIGLLDPVAKMPYESLQQLGIDKSSIALSTKPFQSLESPIISERFRRRYQVPETVIVEHQTIDELGLIKLNGVVDANWLNDNYETLQDSQFATSVDTTNLKADEDTLRPFLEEQLFADADEISESFELVKRGTEFVLLGELSDQLVNKIQLLDRNSAWIELRAEQRFDLAEFLKEVNSDNQIEFSSQLNLSQASNERVNSLVSQLKQLQAKAKPESRFQVIIQGHTDGPSENPVNIRLRQQRAEVLYDRLSSSGLNAEQFDIQISKQIDSFLKLRSAEYRVVRVTD
jgi:outer membrane protein OmpA-like peptidoglycan-associated protein